MKLWIQWLQALRYLRPACTRALTFLWMTLVLMGLCCRSDNLGVTSFVRVLSLRGVAYHRFLHLFHSKALDLDILTSCWVRLCLALFRPFQVGTRLVCLADGIKAPKEGKRMPGVKLLHQESQNNTKPEYIMGHSFQAISLLVHCAGGQVAAVPLTSRIHEGLVFSNRDSKTLLDKLVALLLSITLICNRPVMLVADAYYASGKVITPLLKNGHHLVTRAKTNAVAYLPASKGEKPSGGDPASTVRRFASRTWPQTIALLSNLSQDGFGHANDEGRTDSRRESQPLYDGENPISSNCQCVADELSPGNSRSAWG